MILKRSKRGERSLVPDLAMNSAKGIGLVDGMASGLPPVSQPVFENFQPQNVKKGENPKIINPRYPVDIDKNDPAQRRNLIDHYQSMSEDIIRGDLDKKRHEFVILCENFGNDFNLATNVRNNNAFLGREIWISGHRKYDKRGAVGTYLYEHVFYAKTSIEVIENFKAKGYRIVAADNIGAAQDLREYQWEPKSLIVLGQEKIGVTNEALEMADDIVFIPQFGSVRSINVGVAGGIIMYDYVSKLKLAAPLPGNSKR